MLLVSLKRMTRAEYDAYSRDAIARLAAAEEAAFSVGINEATIAAERHE